MRRQKLQAKGVTRIDDPGRHGVGWYARVVYRGKTFSKYFADMSHGGTESAFRKALAWRNATEKLVGKPRTDRTFTGGVETVDLTDSGGADGMTTIDSTLGESVTFANSTTSLTITTNGSDLVRLNSVDAAFAAAVNLNVAYD